jgi:hypothetical protein
MKPGDEDGAGGALGALQGAMMPVGCMLGLVAGLFWLVMIGLAIFIGWILSLPSPK